MVRPCVERGSSIWWEAVLHQCIRSLVGAVLLRTIMDISARATSLTDRPQRGHVGHQCSHAPGRPILHLYLSSRRPRLETVDRVTSSLAPHTAQFLCSSLGRSFVPARMYGPAVRCKRFVDLVVSGLASMYPVSS